MLDVERGQHVDAGVEQLLDILPTLGMTAARRIGVRQLVHQYERGAAAEDGIDVHLGQRAAEIFELTPWNDFEWLDQYFGLGPSVGFDTTDDDIEASEPPFGSR